MIDKIKHFTTSFNSIKPAMLKQVFDVPSVQAQAVDLNTETQLYDKGETSDGLPLGYYSPRSVEYKTTIAGSLGNDTRVSHITLRDTGTFYKSFRMKTFRDGFVIVANTIKDDTDLAEAYGESILGLSDESINELMPEVVERFSDLVRKKILG